MKFRGKLLFFSKIPSMETKLYISDCAISVSYTHLGHGYGLSQAGANARAREGWKAEEILTYFYKNIELISE